jgi:phage host-nuclease inhibitor protein Gam
LSIAVEDITQVAEQANELLGRIGSMRREGMKRQKDLDDAIQKLKDEQGPAIDQLAEEEKDLIRELTALVMPSFSLLASPGTKTIVLRNGEIKQRRSDPALDIAEGVAEENIITRIKRLRGVRRFLRVKITYELKKDALTAAPNFVAKVMGLAIVRRTRLHIRPSEVQGQKIKTGDPLNVVVATETIVAAKS